MFVKYSPDVKYLAVRARLEDDKSLDDIRNLVKRPISQKSIDRWVSLYQSTRAVIRDPASYETVGCPYRLSREEADHFRELVDSDPSYFLDELRECFYRRSGEWPSLSTVQREVTVRLGLTLKTARRVHAKQCPTQRAEYTLRMSQYPSNYLAFTDESAVCDRGLHRKKARSPKGLRSTMRLPKIGGKRYSVLPVVTQDGVLTAVIKEGSIYRTDFKRFLKNQVVRIISSHSIDHSFTFLP